MDAAVGPSDHYWTIFYSAENEQRPTEVFLGVTDPDPFDAAADMWQSSTETSTGESLETWGRPWFHFHPLS